MNRPAVCLACPATSSVRMGMPVPSTPAYMVRLGLGFSSTQAISSTAIAAPSFLAVRSTPLVPQRPPPIRTRAWSHPGIPASAIAPVLWLEPANTLGPELIEIPAQGAIGDAALFADPLLDLNQKAGDYYLQAEGNISRNRYNSLFTYRFFQFMLDIKEHGLFNC